MMIFDITVKTYRRILAWTAGIAFGVIFFDTVAPAQQLVPDPIVMLCLVLAGVGIIVVPVLLVIETNSLDTGEMVDRLGEVLFAAVIPLLAAIFAVKLLVFSGYLLGGGGLLEIVGAVVYQVVVVSLVTIFSMLLGVIIRWFWW